MKKNLFLIVLLCAVGGAAPAWAQTIFTQTVNNFEFQFVVLDDVEKEVSISAIEGHHAAIKGLLELPNTVDYEGTTYTVTEVASLGFSSCPITRLICNSSLRIINSGAFRDIKSTTIDTVAFNKGLEYIGNRAFCQSKGLTGKVVIPASVTFIGDYSFMNTSIGSFELESTVPPVLEDGGKNLLNGLSISVLVPCGSHEAYLQTDWEPYAYDPCDESEFLYHGLRCAIIDAEDGTQEVHVVGLSGIQPAERDIPEYAEHTFEDGITKTFPVTAIDSGVFSGNTDIETLVLHAPLRRIGDHAFYKCTSLKVLEWENCTQLQTIAAHAFCYTGLQGDLVIPSSVDSIGRNAFYDTQVTSVELLSEEVPWLGGASAFYKNQIDEGGSYVHLVEQITVPCGTGAAYRKAAQWKLLSCVAACEAFDDNGIAYEATSDTTAKVTGALGTVPTALTFQETININGTPHHVREIAANAFSGVSITSLNIPSSIRVIGNAAFRDISSAFTLTLNEGLDTIGDRAFCKASGIQDTLYIPASVRYLDDAAFHSCTGVKAIKMRGEYPPAVKGSQVFFLMNTLLVYVPCGAEENYFADEDFKALGLNIYDPCAGTTIIKDGIQYHINTEAEGNEVFVQGVLGKLQVLDIPSQVTSEAGVTYDVTAIDSSACLNNPYITEIILPSTVKEIRHHAFYQAGNLRSLTLSEGLETIGERAFVRTQIQELTIPASVTSIGLAAFHTCTTLTKVMALSAIPPTTATDAFTNDTLVQEVSVPCGAMEAYKHTLGWKTLPNYVTQCKPLELTDGEALTRDTVVSSITFKRTFPMNQWCTLYLPFDVAAVEVYDPEDGQFWDVNRPYNGTGYFYLQELQEIDAVLEEIRFEQVTELEGYKPYIIQFSNKNSHYFDDKEIYFRSAEGEVYLTNSEVAPATDENSYRIMPNNLCFDQTLSSPAYRFEASDSGCEFVYVPNPVLHPFEYLMLPPEKYAANPVQMPRRLSARLGGQGNGNGGSVTTSVSDVATDDISFRREGNQLLLQTNGHACSLYSVEGILLHTVEAGQQTVTIPLVSGMYILYCEGNSRKILL